jgi:hypothetical protein
MHLLDFSRQDRGRERGGAAAHRPAILKTGRRPDLHRRSADVFRLSISGV